MAGNELERLRELPVHAVGEATATAAEVAGFGVAAKGTSGVDELLGELPAGGRLLHLCGEDRRAPAAPSQLISSVPVYRAASVDAPDLSGLEGAVALIHSPRGGRRLAEIVPDELRATVRPRGNERRGSAGRGHRLGRGAHRALADR